MADTETAKFQAEISRLNKIIDVLVETNGQLKHLLAFYQQTVSLPENLLYSNHLQENGMENLQDDTGRNNNGVKNVQRHTGTENNGVMNVQRHIGNQESGVMNVQQHAGKTDNGVKNGFDNTFSFITGVNSTPEAVPGSVNGAENAPSSAVSIAKEEKPVRYQYLCGLLHEANTKANWDSIQNTALILIRLHESPKQSIKDLQKLTGLSEDGMVKRIMSLKKFGLVVRGKGRQLLLTSKTTELLNKSRG